MKKWDPTCVWEGDVVLPGDSPADNLVQRMRIVVRQPIRDERVVLDDRQPEVIIESLEEDAMGKPIWSLEEDEAWVDGAITRAFIWLAEPDDE